MVVLEDLPQRTLVAYTEFLEQQLASTSRGLESEGLGGAGVYLETSGRGCEHVGLSLHEEDGHETWTVSYPAPTQYAEPQREGPTYHTPEEGFWALFCLDQQMPLPTPDAPPVDDE
jgi:hypothetical protein